ncbi:MAG TPA: type VII secretion integral membrane protein EccD [Streptosporangiaceae bacterium]|nr:type VII secretion integral membrane protein EccD [Streptosporangiaceae bacterium]
MASAAASDLCRVTVVGPSRRVDIALPYYVTFADLFPTVARFAGIEGPDWVGEKGGWVLQRLGEEPFAPAMTPQQVGLVDGELIYLRPHRAQLPLMAFDDVADVIASGLSEQPGRWAARHARWVMLGAGLVALAAGAVFILRCGPPWPVPALASAVFAVGLLLAVLAVSRAWGDSLAGALLGYAAIPYAFLAGLLGTAGAIPLARIGAAHVLSAFGAAALAAVLAAVASAELPLYSGVVLASLLAVAAAWIGSAFGIGFAAAALVVAVLALALTPLIPSVSFRLARMALPQVPADAGDLRRDTLTIDGAKVFARTASADRFVTGVVSGIGLVGAAATGALALTRSWLGLTACAVLACVLLLRSRLFRGVGQRLWLLVPGFGGLLLLAVGQIHGSSQAQHLTLALGPLAAGVAVAVGVGLWLPGHRPSPIWGRIADVADTALIISLIPLALGVAGVFGKVRGLGG